jgi:hypothetical protein
LLTPIHGADAKPTDIRRLREPRLSDWAICTTGTPLPARFSSVAVVPADATRANEHHRLPNTATVYAVRDAQP